jgi:hypothetical protein
MKSGQVGRRPRESGYPRADHFSKAGTLGIRVAGKEQVVGPGAVVIVERAQPHVWWNAGSEPLRILTDFRPALRTEVFFETLFGLARDGELSPTGMPRFLQVVVLVPSFEMYLAKPPVPLQKALFAILGPLAWFRGYRAEYPKYSATGSQSVKVNRSR